MSAKTDLSAAISNLSPAIFKRLIDSAIIVLRQMSPDITGYIDEHGQPVIVDPAAQIRVKTIPVDMRGILLDMEPLGVTEDDCVLLFSFLSIVDQYKEGQKVATIN